MRVVGHSVSAIPLSPSADGLRRAAVHQATGSALASVCSTGIAKGVYRFKSHEEADAQVSEALARVMALNAQRQRRIS
jgi:hypothetical protein